MSKAPYLPSDVRVKIEVLYMLGPSTHLTAPIIAAKLARKYHLYEPEIINRLTKAVYKALSLLIAERFVVYEKAPELPGSQKLVNYYRAISERPLQSKALKVT